MERFSIEVQSWGRVSIATPFFNSFKIPDDKGTKDRQLLKVIWTLRPGWVNSFLIDVQRWGRLIFPFTFLIHTKLPTAKLLSTLGTNNRQLHKVSWT